jgi:hypothetical protein
MRGAVVAALTVGCAAGCADPGEPFQQRLNLSQPMTGQQRINGPGYEMTLGRDIDNTRLELPTSFRIADAYEVLASGMCPTEGLAGIAIYPGVIASGEVPATSSIRVTQQGAAIVQLAIDFEVDYQCGGSQTLAGTTTYTFFTSNRIVRHDEITSSSTTTLSRPVPQPCGCANFDANYFFTSFWSFNSDRLLDLEGDEVATGNALQRGCTRFGEHLLGVEWLQSGPTRVVRPSGFPVSVYDFAAGVQTLPARSASVTSSINIGFNIADDRRCLDAHANLVRNPIIVDGMQIFAEERSGLYIDTRVHTGGQFELRAEDGDVPPFGIILDLGTAKYARVSRSQGAYAVQQVPDQNTYLFYFDDGLGMNDSILIEPY